MPVNYPVVPVGEDDVRQRIVRKYMEYMAVANGPNPDAVQLRGERYEIAVAINLYQKGRFTNGNQISRWHTAGVAQNINVGANTDYDFVIPSSNQIPGMPQVQGPILGEAKSYTNGLGPYIKKAVGYCLNDPTIGGFCFVTPGPDYELYLQMVQTAIPILAGREGTPAITGHDAWHNNLLRNGKPSGPQIRTHFTNQYYGHPQHTALTAQNYLEVLQNQHAGDVTGYVKYQINPYNQQQRPALYQRRDNRRGAATHFNQELAQRAGFVIACYRVPNVTHDEIRDMVGNLP